LERRPWLVQESQLSRAGATPQNRIAVRVAAEAVDDGLVGQLEVQVVLVAQLRKQRQHQRQRVLRKGARRVSVHVARELAQHPVLRQPPLGRWAPRKQLTLRGCLQRVAKPRANGFAQRL
jgi:hypothetical protein